MSQFLFNFCKMAQNVKNLPAMQETSLFPELERSPHAEKNGYPLQYSCLENSRDTGAWWATVNGVAGQTRLSN